MQAETRPPKPALSVKKDQPHRTSLPAPEGEKARPRPRDALRLRTIQACFFFCREKASGQTTDHGERCQKEFTRMIAARSPRVRRLVLSARIEVILFIIIIIFIPIDLLSIIA
jgi:hypothetical protein